MSTDYSTGCSVECFLIKKRLILSLPLTNLQKKKNVPKDLSSIFLMTQQLEKNTFIFGQIYFFCSKGAFSEGYFHRFLIAVFRIQRISNSTDNDDTIRPNVWSWYTQGSPCGKHFVCNPGFPATQIVSESKRLFTAQDSNFSFWFYTHHRQLLRFFKNISEI